MAYRKLSWLRLDKDIKASLSLMGLKTVKDVLVLPPFTLMNSLQWNASQCEELLDNILSQCLPPGTTAYEMEQAEQQNSIPLGSYALDTLLHGGLLAGSIAEFVGPPGVGKTQWCLHISASVVVADKDKETSASVIYIDTECTARPERIVEMMRNRYPELAAEIPRLLSRIHVFRPKTTAAMLEILDSLELIVVEKDARVVIVDSITAIDDCLSTTSRRVRASQLSSWAAKLKAVAHRLNICVVVTNQITTMLEPHLPEPDLPEPELPEPWMNEDPEDYMLDEEFDDTAQPENHHASEFEGHAPQPERQHASEFEGHAPQPERQHASEFEGHAPHPERQHASESEGHAPQPERQHASEFEGHAPQPEKHHASEFEGHAPQPEKHHASESEGHAPQPERQHVSEYEGHAPQPERQHASESEGHAPQSKNSVPDQEYVSDPEDCLLELMTGPEECMDPDEASMHLIPAMGNTWTHCITTRIVLQYTDSARELVIAKSPVSPFAAFPYFIREDGITVDETDGRYSYSGPDPGLFRMRAQEDVSLDPQTQWLTD